MKLLKCVAIIQAGLSLLSVIDAQAKTKQNAPINIGSRRELFVDKLLIERVTGGVSYRLHHPIRQEIVLETDKPWEGNTCSYCSIFKDGDIFRLYYRGLGFKNDGEINKIPTKNHKPVMCYAESKDGITWQRPDLNLVEFNDSKKNNIIFDSNTFASIKGDPAHCTFFKDSNPDCPASERYKALMMGKPHGLYLLVSADGINFKLHSNKPIITKGKFDSQNVMFYDVLKKQYRIYYRGTKKGVRSIYTSSSSTPYSFPEPEWVKLTPRRYEDLYTNQIAPYYRAPHYYFGFPLRYTDRSWKNDAIYDLPGQKDRLRRGSQHPRYGAAITDSMFICSRDGKNFKRRPEAFLRPGQLKENSWVYGDNFIFYTMIETKSTEKFMPNELSFFTTEGYWQGNSTSFRRHTLRLDGFVSLHGTWASTATTKPIIFEGGNLEVNFATSGRGFIQVALLDLNNKPIAGYTRKDCGQIFGDHTKHIVRWKANSGDLRQLSGKPIKIRFVLEDADIFSFRFVPYSKSPKREPLNWKW